MTVINRIETDGCFWRDDLRACTCEYNRSPCNTRPGSVVVGNQNHGAGTSNKSCICGDNAIDDHVIVGAQVDGTTTAGGDRIDGHATVTPGDHVNFVTATGGSDRARGGHVISSAHIDHRIYCAGGDPETGDYVTPSGQLDC